MTQQTAQQQQYQNYLHKMGITYWRSRNVMVLLRDNKQLLGLITARYDISADVGEQEALLNKISQALKLSFEIIEQPVQSAQSYFQQSLRFVILMGRQSAGLYQSLSSSSKSSTVIETHSLSQLLMNPALKKETWRDLQTILAQR